LVFERAIVFAVAKTLSIETKDHAAIADVVHTIPDNQWRRCDALKGPVIRSPGLELHMGLLPHELPVRLTECHKHTAIAWLTWIAHQFVVCTDKHHSIGDDRIPVALRSQFRNPLDVFPCLHVPLARQSLHVGDHVAVWRPSPHWPVPGARLRTSKSCRTE